MAAGVAVVVATAVVVAVPIRPSTGRAEDRASYNSADRILFWVPCGEVAALTDAELNRWRRRGVDGFICMSGYLAGWGGTEYLGDDPAHRPPASGVSLRRQLQTSHIVQRARSRGMDVYLGMWTQNYYNHATPLRDWFDSRAWSSDVLPRFRGLAHFAKRLGMSGIALDQELYPDEDQTTTTWKWRYPGDRHTERAVRAQVRLRGAETMHAILSEFPAASLIAYATAVPTSWAAKVEADHGLPNAYADDVRLDFWDGLTSVRGYSSVVWLDSIFYKTAHDATWSAALRYNANAVYALLSRRLSGWAYAAPRLQVAPFAWIDAGTTPFEQAQPPRYVARQLAEFAKWGGPRTFAVFAYRGLHGFDYRPYVAGLRAASAPEVVDDQRPELAVTSPDPGLITTSRGSLTLEGFADDDLAVRSASWRDQRGQSGMIGLTYDAARNRDTWRVTVPLAMGATRLTLTATDLKGLTDEQRLVVNRTA